MSKFKNWWNRVVLKKKPVVAPITPASHVARIHVAAPTQSAPVVEKAKEKKVEESIEVGVSYEPIVIDDGKVVGSDYNKIKSTPENLNAKLGGQLDKD